MKSTGVAVSVFIAPRRERGVDSRQSFGQTKGEEGCGSSRDIPVAYGPRLPGLSVASMSAPHRRNRRLRKPGWTAKLRLNPNGVQPGSMRHTRGFTVAVAAISAVCFVASATAATVKPVPANVALAFKKAAVAARHGGQIQCAHGVDNHLSYPKATYSCTFYRKNPKGKTTLTVGKRKVRVTVTRTVTAELLAPRSVNADIARCRYTVDDTAHTVYDGQWDVCEEGWQQHVPFLTP